MVRPMILLQRSGLTKGKRGVTMSEKRFLVQRKSDGETWCSLMNSHELIEYINFSDCHNEEWRILNPNSDIVTNITTGNGSGKFEITINSNNEDLCLIECEWN